MIRKYKDEQKEDQEEHRCKVRGAAGLEPPPGNRLIHYSVLIFPLKHKLCTVEPLPKKPKLYTSEEESELHPKCCRSFKDNKFIN